MNANLKLWQWDKYELNAGLPGQVPLLKPPIRQTHEGCRFSAVARCMGYKLRLKFDRAYPHLPPLHPEVELVHYAVLHRSFQGLPQAGRGLSSVLDYARDDGVRLFNNTRFRIVSYLGAVFAEELLDAHRRVVDRMDYYSKLHELMRYLSDGPIVGTMGIFDGYSRTIGGVYTRRGPCRDSHCIVILGLLPVDGRLCFTYQESGGSDEAGGLGSGVNIGDLNVLLKIYKIDLRLPAELHPIG